MNRFWRWFYSYEGISLQLSKTGKMVGLVLTIISLILVIGSAVSVFVLDNQLMSFQFGCGLFFCAWVVRGLIAKDLSRQLKKQMKKE